MTNCHQLKLKANDGKYRMTDVVDIEGNLGELVVSNQNSLEYQYVDDKNISNNDKLISSN